MCQPARLHVISVEYWVAQGSREHFTGHLRENDKKVAPSPEEEFWAKQLIQAFSSPMA